MRKRIGLCVYKDIEPQFENRERRNFDEHDFKKRQLPRFSLLPRPPLVAPTLR